MTASRTGHPLRGVLIALTLPALAYGLLTGLSGQPAPAPRPAPAVRPCASQVAMDLGLDWTPDQGVTEMIESFHFGVIRCEEERGEWICWNEENVDSPSGLERICGGPTLLNDTLSSGTRVWEVFLHPTFPPCMEDEECWDCRIMGNLTCGIPSSSSTSTASARPLALAG